MCQNILDNDMKLCIIYSIAPRYREAIFKLIDKEYDCDWYFGHTKTDIKEMDFSLLKHVSFYKSLGNPRRFNWRCGILKLLFNRKYNCFLILSESRCLTDYIFFFLAYFFFPKKKINVWTHGWYGKESAIESRLKLWMFRHVDRIFVYGNHAKQLMIRLGLQEDKIFVIHNSLNYEKQLELRKLLRPSNIYSSYFKNTCPTLIFIGRLTEVKRLDLLIAAMVLLKRRGEIYNLIFVGDGEMRKQLEQDVKQRGIEDNVWFYGACYDEQINAELIYNADLCVAPGNVGLTAMHTMVFGCPVITHNDFKWQMPEFEAIHSGSTGDFFERGNVENLADVVSCWFASKQEQRESVRQACFHEIDSQWTPQFQIEVMNKGLKY